MMILKAFDHWCSESTADIQSFLDYRIQLQAFAIIVRDTVPFPHGVGIIVKCFQLDQLTDPQDCIVLIHQLLDKKDFYKVRTSGTRASCCTIIDAIFSVISQTFFYLCY